MSRYTLSDFNNIFKNTGLISLPNNIIEIIHNLSGKVGAPEYIKTPQFSKSISTINRRKKKYIETKNDDWVTIRTFQTTEFKKKDGIEYNINLIRKYLNMITNNTYIKIKDNIINEIKSIDSSKNDLDYLCREIFKIIIENTVYSDVYAKLYKDLIEEFSIFNDILLSNFKKFELLFESIEYVDPEKDYNKFCEINKENEIRRSICIFYINLMKENIIEKAAITSILLNLFNMLNKMIASKTKKNEIDELSEILYIFTTNCYEHLDKNIATEIYNNIIKITKIKCKDEPGITNKCIFKHMDMLDEIS